MVYNFNNKIINFFFNLFEIELSNNFIVKSTFKLN